LGGPPMPDRVTCEICGNPLAYHSPCLGCRMLDETPVAGRQALKHIDLRPAHVAAQMDRELDDRPGAWAGPGHAELWRVAKGL